MKRRDFLKTAVGAGALGLTASLARPLMAIPENSKYKDTIGLQLWTVRDQLKQDKQATLKSVADAGYQQVEFGGVDQGLELQPICKDLGLKMTSSFINWQSICNPKNKKVPTLGSLIEDAKKLELKHLVFGYIGKKYRQTADQFRLYIERSNQFGEMCKKADIQLCYHNHAFEFKKLEDGKTGFDLLIAGFDRNYCKFELDVFWAKIGGWDPYQTLQQLDGRVSQVHLKDLKSGAEVCYDEGQVPHDAFKELGNGSIDMAKVIKISKAIGVEQCHVEQDQSPNPIKSIGQSIAHLKTL
ncbi:MAG: TIM barrel protein [Planctomycetota bacterium]|nr:TIM barrel protein [Planctomycetota bacterium]